MARRAGSGLPPIAALHICSWTQRRPIIASACVACCSGPNAGCIGPGPPGALRNAGGRLEMSSGGDPGAGPPWPLPVLPPTA
eukprot:7385727-Alexandrium_andersonii.AAC.1